MQSRVSLGRTSLAPLSLGLCCLITLATLAALGRDASANGRAPGTSTINFRRGMESHIAAGMTFGLVISTDNGATWRWVCEDAIGYGGMYDPDYVFTSSGALFATTFDGMKVNRDGCTFSSPNGTKFVSTIAQGPTGAVFIGAADGPSGNDPGDSKIYRSDDDGQTWTVSSEPGVLNDWWQTLEVAPSDGNRVYLSGFRFVPNPNGGAGNVIKQLLFRSDDAGASWVPLPVDQFLTMPNSRVEVAGISSTDPDLVFVRVTLEDNNITDAIYRSTDAGQTWKKLYSKGSAISFLVRRNGDLIAATQALGTVKSADNGETWTPLANAPHINCLNENSAGEVWACTQNYGGMQAPSDDFGIMKSADLVTWTPVLKYQQIQEPVACADGTVQKSRCDAELWCGLCLQLGCDPHRECAGAPSDAGGDPDPEPEKGCCKNSAAPAPGALLLVLALGFLLVRPRRR